MKKSILFFVLTIIFVSCKITGGVPLEKKTSENNSTYNVSYLFEHEGCKVYRFYDNGNYVYFINSAGSTTSIKDDSTATRVSTITNNKLP